MPDRRRTTLPKDFEALLDDGDLTALRAVFDTRLPDARGGHAKRTALAFDTCPDDLARWLVAQGADVTARDGFGRSPLLNRAASPRGSVAVLLELGADAHERGPTGTPLHLAAVAKHVGNVALLLAHGVPVDVRDHERLTPLEATLRRCTNIQVEDTLRTARVLLDAGAARTPAAREHVEQIGRRFEQDRSMIAAEYLDGGSAALVELYALFDVAPVPPRVRHDGTSRVTVSATTWRAQHAELWDLLVPGTGPAATVQGEAVRLSGRIWHEVDDNGAVNWDADFRAMTRALIALLATGTPLPSGDLARAAAVGDALARSGDGDTAALAELAVAWVLLNPDPAPLPAPAYRR